MITSPQELARGANHPQRLDDPTRALRILEGRVDVFALAPDGARFPLWRAGAGDALAGIEAGEFALLAVAAPGARWQEIAARDVSPDEIERWNLEWAQLAGETENCAPRDILRRVVEERLTAAQDRIASRGAGEERARESGWKQLLPGSKPAAHSDPFSALGGACRIVCEAAGIEIRVRPDGDAREDFALSAGLEAVETLAQNANLRSRGVELNGNWWQQEAGPLVGFWRGETLSTLATKNEEIEIAHGGIAHGGIAHGGIAHGANGAISIDQNPPPKSDEASERWQPVALLPLRSGGYRVVDARSGGSWIVSRALDAQIAPRAVMFYRPFPDRPLGALELLRFGMRGAWRDLTAIGILSIAAGLLALLPPLVTAQIFDSVLPGAEASRLAPLALLLSTFAVVSALLGVARGAAVLRVESRLDGALQSALWDRLVRLSPAFFRGFEAGDLATRALAIGGVRQLLSGALVSSILGAFFAVFNWVLLFIYDVPTALAATGAMILAGIVTLAGGVLQLRHERQSRARAAEVAGFSLQLLEGVSTLQIAGASGRAFEQWARRVAARAGAMARAQSVSAATGAFDAAFPLLASMALFGAVAFGASQRLSTGQFLAFSVAFGALLAAFLEVARGAIALLRAVPLLESARPILSAIPENQGDKLAPGELEGAIEIAGVSFGYQVGGPLILDDVSLQIAPGEFVALVGPSGSGKSTLLRLILGFEIPQSGGIYFDGRDLSLLDLDAVRRQFGVVLQSGRLLPGSIYSNIAGAGFLPLSDAWRAARGAGLAEEIEGLPMGMHTIIGEGSTFSGGQKQRVLIARALARNPKILLFDEATSALDNLTQAQVSRSLEEIGATRVVVAHRLSTIKNADRIAMMVAGKIVESGTYEELLKANGAFAELVRRQLA